MVRLIFRSIAEYLASRPLVVTRQHCDDNLHLGPL
jgi:hypothetical protein